MSWCQFIDWLKFEACPSSQLNFGMAYQNSLCIFLQVNKVLLQNCNSKENSKCSGHLVSSDKLSSASYACLNCFNTFFKSLDLFTISPYLKSYAIPSLLVLRINLKPHPDNISWSTIFLFSHHRQVNNLFVTDRLTIYLSNKDSKKNSGRVCLIQ